MTTLRNKVAEEVEALIMKSAFEDYVTSHGLLGPMDPDARRQKRNAFVAGWKASRRAAAEPEAKDWDPFGPPEQIPEDIRRDTVTEKGWRR